MATPKRKTGALGSGNGREPEDETSRLGEMPGVEPVASAVERRDGEPSERQPSPTPSSPHLESAVAPKLASEEQRQKTAPWPAAAKGP